MEAHRPFRQPVVAVGQLFAATWVTWWGEEDLNLRRLRRQIYSLLPLATRAPPHVQSMTPRGAKSHDTPRDLAFSTSAGGVGSFPPAAFYDSSRKRLPMLEAGCIGTASIWGRTDTRLGVRRRWLKRHAPPLISDGNGAAFHDSSRKWCRHLPPVRRLASYCPVTAIQLHSRDSFWGWLQLRAASRRAQVSCEVAARLCWPRQEHDFGVRPGPLELRRRRFGCRRMDA